MSAQLVAIKERLKNGGVVQNADIIAILEHFEILEKRLEAMQEQLDRASYQASYSYDPVLL